MLQNEASLAIVAVHTAENGPFLFFNLNPAPVLICLEVPRPFARVQPEVPMEEQMPEVFKLYRDHCARPIPGYQGHIPGKAGESIFGHRFPRANFLAGEARHHLDYPTWGHP